MKYLLWGLAALIGIIISFVIVERLAAERVEVVELHTQDETGETVTTRLWIVDDEGLQYLRVGSGGSGWFSRLQENKQITLTRAGETATYRTLLRPDKSDQINRLMQQKYTWGDTFIAYVVGGRTNSIAIELQPI